jgi:hypothetical protein
MWGSLETYEFAIITIVKSSSPIFQFCGKGAEQPHKLSRHWCRDYPIDGAVLEVWKSVHRADKHVDISNGVRDSVQIESKAMDVFQPITLARQYRHKLRVRRNSV